MRADFGIPYDVDALKLIDDLRDWGLLVRAVVITRYEDQPSARVFKSPARAPRCARLHPRLHPGLSHGRRSDRQRRGIRRERVHPPPSGRWWWCRARARAAASWPPACPRSTTSTCAATPPATPSSRPSPSGTCRSSTRSTSPTRLPRWSCKDVNQIDPFHLAAYGEQAVNYNRDIEAFPLVARILERIGGDALLPVAHRHGREPRGLRHRGRRRGAGGCRAGGHPALLPLRLRVRRGPGRSRGRASGRS